MIEVVCLKWGDKFGPEYVNNLYNGIKRNTNVPFQLHCYTDDASCVDKGIKCHDLPDIPLTGWWFKIWLFSNEIGIDPGSTIMFFDLDTLVTGNIDNILQCKVGNKLMGLQNFYRPTRFASGLLMWTHGTQHHIWDRFQQDPQGAINSTTDGDQEWTEKNTDSPLHFQQQFYGIYSYKQSCSKGLPLDATIVCYHGTPSIIESYTTTVKNYDGEWLPQEWVKQHWRT